MSLAAKKSDLKNHLSRSTKKHLSPFNSATMTADVIVDQERLPIHGEGAIAKIDLGERTAQEKTDAPQAVMQRILTGNPNR